MRNRIASPSKRRRAFTLIELLVVIAIIAILAAILFPVFAQARAKARQTVCLSNLKQLALGEGMYKQDYDEHYSYWDWKDSADIGPCNEPAPGAQGRGCMHFESIWFNAIYPYVKNFGLYSCPSANDDSTGLQNLYWGWTNHPKNVNLVNDFWNHPINYGISEPLESGGGCGGTHHACSDADTDREAESLLFADNDTGLTTCWRPNRADPKDPAHHYIISRAAYPNLPANCWANGATCGAAQVDLGDYASQLSPNFPTYDQQARHAGGNNVAFCDGHSKFVKDSAMTWDLFWGDSSP